MKFYPNRIIRNIKGEPFNNMNETTKAKEPLTLGQMAVEALLGRLPADQGAPSNLKVMRWKLAQQVQKNIGGLSEDHAMILAAEEVALIKSRILDAFDTMVAGPACDAIEAGEGASVEAIKKA